MVLLGAYERMETAKSLLRCPGFGFKLGSVPRLGLEMLAGLPAYRRHPVPEESQAARLVIDGGIQV